MELSKRLQAVADLVTQGNKVADVGTDHGYIPIYLIQSGKCNKVIAMDVNEGPYLRAKNHVASYRLEGSIDTRLSNGMQKLKENEVDTVIMAGMGGGLVIQILDQDRRLWDHVEEFVLQPQSELDKVRKFLLENQFQVIQEDMILEDGKFYPMMKVKRGKDTCYSEEEFLYGRDLIEKKHPVLVEFIAKEIEIKESVLSSLSDKAGCHIQERKTELSKELELAYEVQRLIR